MGSGYTLHTLHVTEYPGMRVHGAGARFPDKPWTVSYHRTWHSLCDQKL